MELNKTERRRLARKAKKEKLMLEREARKDKRKDIVQKIRDKRQEQKRQLKLRQKGQKVPYLNLNATCWICGSKGNESHGHKTEQWV